MATQGGKPNMLGFNNQVIRVDVGQKAYELIDIPEKILQTRMGAKGLGS